MRKLITIIAAAVAVAACSAFPATEAQAACSQYYLPNTTIYQGNGWDVSLFHKDGTWQAEMRDPTEIAGYTFYYSGRVRFDAFNSDRVKFIITWSTGAAGVYEGNIDANGFVSGMTYDRWHPENRTSWHMADVPTCTG